MAATAPMSSRAPQHLQCPTHLATRMGLRQPPTPTIQKQQRPKRRYATLANGNRLVREVYKLNSTKRRQRARRCTKTNNSLAYNRRAHAHRRACMRAQTYPHITMMGSLRDMRCTSKVATSCGPVAANCVLFTPVGWINGRTHPYWSLDPKRHTMLHPSTHASGAHSSSRPPTPSTSGRHSTPTRFAPAARPLILGRCPGRGSAVALVTKSSSSASWSAAPSVS